MQDVAIALSARTVAVQVADASATPITIKGDPSLWSIHISGTSATLIPSVQFRGIPGSVAIPLNPAQGVHFPLILRRTELGAVLDSDIVLGASAAGPLTVVALYLHDDVYQQVFDMRF